MAYKYKEVNHQSHYSWVRHELYTVMFHVFQAALHTPSAQLAISRMNEFIQEVLKTKSSAAHKSRALTSEESKRIKMIDSHHDL